MVAAIVEAAAKVYAKNGFDAATTNEIAGLAGVSVGSLYQYFPNKLALLFAVNERLEIGVFSQAAAASRDGCHLPWPMSVRHLVEAIARFIGQNRAVVQIIFRELPIEAMHAPESILTEELAVAKAEHDRDLRNLLTAHSAHIAVALEEAVYMVPVIGKGAFAAILTKNPEYLSSGKLADILTDLQLKYLTAGKESKLSLA
jgi:AcrR family transcriptional regulator